MAFSVLKDILLLNDIQLFVLCKWGKGKPCRPCISMTALGPGGRVIVTAGLLVMMIDESDFSSGQRLPFYLWTLIPSGPLLAIDFDRLNKALNINILKGTIKDRAWSLLFWRLDRACESSLAKFYRAFVVLKWLYRAAKTWCERWQSKIIEGRCTVVSSIFCTKIYSLTLEINQLLRYQKRYDFNKKLTSDFSVCASLKFLSWLIICHLQQR